MATEAQIAANRKNAKASTGPKTADGKARSSRNSLNFGLFSTTNCVQPLEQDEYEALAKGLWENLNPIGAAEQMFAAEIVRGAWRLRRCAATEGSLGTSVAAAERKRWVQRQQVAGMTGQQFPELDVKDPLFYQYSVSAQQAVDRARSLASGAVRRATTELRRLQTERLIQSVAFPAMNGDSVLGLASVKDALAAISIADIRKIVESSPAPSTARAPNQTVDVRPGTTNRTQSPQTADKHTEHEAIKEEASENPLASESEVAKRTQSVAAASQPEIPADPHSPAADREPATLTPRSAPCPCGKNLKYKRCCGKQAPAVLHATAA